MLWKCIVSASNHCEVYRQWSLTQDLLNTIIYSAGRRHLWITGIGVCSNSIESATKTSRKFALAWQLGSLGFWCSLLPVLYISPLWNHKNQNRPWTAVFIKKQTETDHKSENGNHHSTKRKWNLPLALYVYVKNSLSFMLITNWPCDLHSLQVTWFRG